ncbi:hypothetical protein CY34DRAFT_20000 [Suillus luteus UH-Slu-Lm8-n1]|uniref:Uncharacterized protein n=1 Tax=Suillus luteus UH-Slu-Lm8-n1 TaxID=930992 RepID=A0A0D0AAV2_9AGAM|nr:hypothetical protein CY34DRAFT_20000 [Suillus luteus UH-Slu-Lm8-n1]
MPAQNIVPAEFCSEIPIANGKTTVLKLMDVSSEPNLIFKTAFRQRFSLPVNTHHQHIHNYDAEVPPSITCHYDAVPTPTSHVDSIISSNVSISTEDAAESSPYLKRFVRKTSTLTYGWFETAGPQSITTPPNFSSFDDIQLGDLFIHRTDQNVFCWIREYSPSGGVWRIISLGDNGSHNEEFSRRILVLHPDGNPTWVLPKTVQRYKRLTRTQLKKPNI